MPADFESSRDYVSAALDSGRLCGRGPFTEKCEELLSSELPSISGALLTTSCTHALEVAAILMNFNEDDEVIVPAYTFVTSALAFHMHGAKLRFCDIREDTLNIDEDKLEDLISIKTKAIVVVHYAGVSCEMDKIVKLAKKHKIRIIEDNAHGPFGKYRGNDLGTFGDLATLSFHETKNFSCGEGGALIVNDGSLLPRAEIVIEKGTNRSAFINGQIDKYTWVDKGSSYVLSDLQAGLLYGQLKNRKEIQSKRAVLWKTYFRELSSWAYANDVKLPFIPNHCEHSYHMFYMIMPDRKSRDNLMRYLIDLGVKVTFHYLPLNNSLMGSKLLLSDQAACPVTSRISDCIIRLPLFYGLGSDDQSKIIKFILKFFLKG